MTDYISREALLERIDDIWDCADMVFEPNDHCCQADDCKSCKWAETKNAIRKIAANLPAADVRPVWISVEDRLPDLHDDVLEVQDEIIPFKVSNPVLVVFNHDEMGVAVYEKDGEMTDWVEEFDGSVLHSVTHWMPLPQLPKEVST